MVYKIHLSVYETQLNNLNNLWIEQHRLNNPQDTVTQRYTEGTIFFGFGYIVKDAVTEQYITDYLEILENVPQWHEEDKAIQIVQNKSGVVWGAMNEPEIAMGLALHRKAMNMQTYEEGDDFYFYVDFILPEHQLIFDTYPNLEITVNQN
jgi:hypothetical protein